MAMMMHMTANKRVMGDFPVSDGLRAVGWCATAVMAMAVAAMLAGLGR
jgi:Mn2+/Fe2+ NRAMP family transporter